MKTTLPLVGILVAVLVFNIALLDDAVKEARTTVKNIKFALGGAVALLVPTMSALVGNLFGVL